MGRAQLIADMFRGRWGAGIPVAEYLAVREEARRHDNDARRWIAEDESRQDHLVQRWGGVLEPLAAGSASAWRPALRELVLIVDVGAGTSDFSVFLVTHRRQATGSEHKALPVVPIADAVRFAGDYVDDVLLDYLLQKGHIEPSTTLGAQAKATVRLSGLRRIKERLFREGSVDVPLTHDVVVSVSKEDFLLLTPIRNFEIQLQGRIRAFLESIHRSFAPLFESITLVLTGGGRDLPMVTSLTQQSWVVHGRTVKFVLASRVPEAFQHYGESFAQEYPQLAVAIGGSLPKILDERDAIDKWQGGERPPGQLERFPTRGV